MLPSKYSIAYPLFLIGVVLIICGLRWLIHPEPWLLDEVANVERLGMSFDQLFEPEINKTLPGYLVQIYRFFGFWVLIVGLLITSISNASMMKHDIIVSRLIKIVGFMIFFGLYLSYTFIPSSHFLYLIWGALLLYVISLFSYIKIKQSQR